MAIRTCGTCGYTRQIPLGPDLNPVLGYRDHTCDPADIENARRGQAHMEKGNIIREQYIHRVGHDYARAVGMFSGGKMLLPPGVA